SSEHQQRHLGNERGVDDAQPMRWPATLDQHARGRLPDEGAQPEANRYDMRLRRKRESAGVHWRAIDRIPGHGPRDTPAGVPRAIPKAMAPEKKPKPIEAGTTLSVEVPEDVRADLERHPLAASV